MSSENQPRQDNDKSMELLIFAVLAVLAWPALFSGALARLLIKKRVSDPFPYWVGAGILGSIGALVLYKFADPLPFGLAVLQDTVPLLFHLSHATMTRFLHDALPLWIRSLLVFPLATLAIEMVSPQSLKEKLLTQERQRRAIQRKKSKRAARLAQKAPDQINGKGVLGALIDNPNE